MFLIIYMVFRVNGVTVRAPELSIPQFRIEIRPESNGQPPRPSNLYFYMVLGYRGVLSYISDVEH